MSQIARTLNRPIVFGLRLIGCWPNCSYTMFSRIFWLITIIALQIFQYWYFAIHFTPSDLMLLMDSLSVALAYSLTLVKLVSLWINHRIFSDMLAEMARDWSECTSAANFRMMTQKAALSHRCSNIIVTLYLIAVSVFGITNIATQMKTRFVDGNPEGVPREMLVKMRLPFNSDGSPIYELVWIAQWLHQAASSFIVGMMNGLILTLIFHLSGQVDILCHSVLEISRIQQSGDSASAKMRELIEQHQKIIEFSEHIEQIFSFIALSQFLSNTIIMCSLGYQIVSAIGTENWGATVMKALWFYGVISIEAFIYCFAGEYLGDKGKAIGDAAYESLWYDLRPHETRILLFVIIRSQKRLTLTIGKFMDLSLQQFTTVMKASASYVSVLLAMH